MAPNPYSRPKGALTPIPDPVTGDETRGEAEARGSKRRFKETCYCAIHGTDLSHCAPVAEPADVEALAEFIGGFQFQQANPVRGNEAVRPVPIALGEHMTSVGRPLAEAILASDWLARRDAERDRARDAEARRVVERVEAVLADRTRVYPNNGTYVIDVQEVRAALAEIEEGSP